MQIQNDSPGDGEGGAPLALEPTFRGRDLEVFELTTELRAELLDSESWGKILELYARTMRLAVALIDPEGQLVGTCHNPQPIWSLARDARPEWGAGCLFCLEPSERCAAASDARRTNSLVLVHDRAGFAHVASPLSLGDRYMGTLIAGQVFDRYPEPLPLQRVAREFGLSAQRLWYAARQQAPISRTNLTVFGNLLGTLGHAFLRERYGGILGRRLAESNRRFRLLVDGAKDYAIFTVDAAGLVTSWNAGAERLLGYTEAEILGQQFSRIFTPEDVQNGVPEKELQMAEHEGRAENERWHVRKDGSRFFVSGILATEGESEFGMIMRDITERQKTEAALRQSQKLESLGVLAGGIAHDFNNLLTGILGNASLILDISSQLDPIRPSLEGIVASSKRAADLTNQLLAYAGKGRFDISKFDLSELVSEMLHLIQTSIPKIVRLELALAPELPWIEADSSQIQQILMNLVINAAEAIGPEGGTVWVSTGVAEIDLGDEGAAGRYVYMEVRDSGCGMDEATRAKIFDPFFTTKFTGRGLGLAAVSGIVRGHHGRMQLESTPGEGSMFRISLPALAVNYPRARKPYSSRNLHGKGTILVVDDEVSVRRVAKSMLEHLGYVVLIAENGLEGVAMVEQRPTDIMAVLLDMAMPVMDGEHALKHIRKIRPDVPVLVSSGYSEVVARARFNNSASVGFIQKPYSLTELAKKIKECCGAVTAATNDAV
jgi:PAS domain S-box-containing protein